MSRSLRTFSIFTRPSILYQPLTRSRHSLLRHNGLIRIQPVRFKRNFQRQAGKLLWRISIGCAVASLILRYFIVVEVETVDDAGEKTIDRTKDDKAEEDGFQLPETIPEDALFIPLGRIRKVEPPDYKFGDPEWQNFVKYRRDGKKIKSIREELAAMVYHHYLTHTPMEQELGAPLKLGRVWLDPLFPRGPPTEYEQSGLEIAGDYTAWCTRPISAEQVARVESALKPASVAISLWESCKKYYSLQLVRAKQYLNTDPASSNTDSQSPASTVAIDELRERIDQEVQPRAHLDKMSDPKSVVGSIKEPAKSASSDSMKIYRSLPPLPQPDPVIDSAITEFKQALTDNWSPPSTQPERGTFLMSGDIELRGRNASLVVEIWAAYHPQDAQLKSLSVRLKRVVQKVPHPITRPKKQ